MPTIEENLGRIATALEKIASQGASAADVIKEAVSQGATTASTLTADKAAADKAAADKAAADKAAADKAAADKAAADKAAADKAAADKAAADKAAADTKPTGGEEVTLAKLQEQAAILLAGGERRTLKSILEQNGAQSLSTAPATMYAKLHADMAEAIENMSLT